MNHTFIPTSGILDLIFHKTWLQISILGSPPNGYKITLIGLIIITIIAIAATAITERLAGGKPGGLLAGIIITLIGAWLFSVYVNLPAPLDYVLETVALVPAFLGAIIVAVFYVLLRKQFKGGK